MTRSRLLLAALAVPLLVQAPVWADGQTKVTLTAENQNVRNVVTQLATAAGVQVRLRPEVRGSVTVRVQGTAFEQALSVVLAPLELGWRLDAGVYVVGRFGDEAGQRRVEGERIELAHTDAAALCRSFGYLDLDSLGAAGPVVDLRHLLPPGLDGPPRPVAGTNALLASGTATAVADLRHVVEALDAPRPQYEYRLTVAEVSPEWLAGLKVYWAQGPMNFARSEGRTARFSSGEFDDVARRLAAGGEGVRVQTAPRLAQQELITGVLGHPSSDGQPGVDLRLAARVEAGLVLRLWLKGTFTFGERTVRLDIDGAPVPPEEHALAVSLPATGADEVGPLLVLVQPVLLEE